MNGLLFQLPTKVTKSNLKAAMQQAIEIEIATIPVYLYTYYSITRAPNQSNMETQILADMKATQEGKKQPKTDAELAEAAKNLALDIMVFANKAGALIMSVAVEEMLHMSLSSNIKSALGKYGGVPELVGKTPKIWPAYLPGHVPAFPINRGKLNKEQLKAFLLIESPLPFKNKEGEEGKAIEYTTIGEYYQKIMDCIENELDDKDFKPNAPQLLSEKGYYAQNNIDTIYYDENHKPQFSNEDDSGGLIHVRSKASAIKAMEEIVEQGEGATQTIHIEISEKIEADIKLTGDHLTPEGNIVCPLFPLGTGMTNPLDYDDKDKKELSHFDKFLNIYCTIERKNHELNTFLGTENFDFTNYFVKDLPLNPSTSDYPTAIQNVSNLTNAIYTYIFVMSEACYKTAGHKQYEIFMFGIHKSMIWLLGVLCDSMSYMTYIDASGKLQNVAPTFEDYNFDNGSRPKDQNIALAGIAMATGSTVTEGMLGRIKDLPDVPLETYLIENQADIV